MVSLVFEGPTDNEKIFSQFLNEPKANHSITSTTMFDNSQRMNRLKDYLEKSSKGQPKPKTKKNKTSSSKTSPRSKPPSGDVSVSESSTTTMSSSLTLSPSKRRKQCPDVTSVLKLKSVLKIQNEWRKALSQAKDPVDLGESVLLHMIEIDPQTRRNLNIESFRSAQTASLCHEMVDIVDLFVETLGPAEMATKNDQHILGDLQGRGIPSSVLVKALVSVLLQDDQSEEWRLLLSNNEN